jgi:hypothetical protein
MIAEGMCRGGPGFEKTILILVDLPVTKAFLGGIQADPSCTPQILKALCLNVFFP